MAVSTSFLNALKVSQLKTIASLTGINSSGTKAVLLSRLRKELLIPKLPSPLPQYPQESKHGSAPSPHFITEAGISGTQTSTRIISVDMGIRNLAYCVLDIPAFPVQSPQDEVNPAPPTPIIQAWQRIAIAPKPVSSSGGVKLDVGDENRLVSANAASLDPEDEAGLASTSSLVTKEAFEPPVYARHAYDLVSKTLLPYRPSQILIERQRYRSMGSAAIQEWTVRVNMFEAMLYAVFETLCREEKLPGNEGKSDSFSNIPAVPAVVPVAPGKVASFWLEDRMVRMTSPKLHQSETTDSELGVMGTSAVSKSSKIPKIPKNSKSQNKASKIDIVGNWLKSNFLGGETCTTTNASPQIGIRVGADAIDTARAFFAKWNKNNTSSRRGGKKSSLSLPSSSTQKKGKQAAGKAGRELTRDEGPMSSSDGENELQMGKLDDLADCLLQGMAWVRWEYNRQRIVAGALDHVLETSK
ncbi:ribonuclease H-like protein [Xylona heveae TC161]|uniref:Ribonuclease H-like protein n=1 Tax=Xylona heveae (strain CBS 132557 / TC161) TaxID=1328760 RepID=A0A165J4N0_XYLHT|nr:ribonuclease H-like protein [Xylona heveae TC161]KZF25725.1 ribonuclease H-like protein [Xylona heveae TC161]